MPLSMLALVQRSSSYPLDHEALNEAIIVDSNELIIML